MTDLQELLNEVSADSPCGDYLEYDADYLELGRLILGKPEDPISGEKAQPPSWRDIHKGAYALLQRSKDLQVAIYLLRALIHLEGISGFRNGLNLLSDLLQSYWNDIHPLLDPDDHYDPTARINIIEELSNFDSVLWPLSLAPLVDSRAIGRFSLRDFNVATDKIEVSEDTAKPELNVIKAAFMDVSAEAVEATYQAITDSEQTLRQLDSFIGEQVGIGSGPDLSALASELRDMRGVIEQLAGDLLSNAQTHEQELESFDDGSEQPVSASPAIKQNLSGAINSRQDVLKALDLICKYYAANEPSSPVPIFLQRAKGLVTADFTQIVQNLFPDAVAQMQIYTGPDSDSSNDSY